MLICRLADLSGNKQLRGTSFHTAFECTAGFIIYLNKTKKKVQSRLGARRGDSGYLQEPLSSRAAFHLAASLVNVRAQPRGPLPRSDRKALIGRVSSSGIENRDNSPKKCATAGRTGSASRRRRYYFQVPAPVVALIWAFAHRRLLWFSYQRMNLVFGTAPEKY